MKTGDKIAQLRREQNLTQEQLAQIMNVSRQSISKWESNAAYPETEKLIQLGKLFHCSMDYLLNEDIEDRYDPNSGSSRTGNEQAGYTRNEYSQAGYSQFDGTQAGQQGTYQVPPISISLGRLRFEYKSKKTFLGMPLVHICAGCKKPAKGVIAVGLHAKGIVSIGLLSTGIISFGLLSIGIFSIGLLALGFLAFGSIAVGAIAFGAVAIGIVSVGACSIGLFSIGAYANGYYVAIGDTAVGKIGIGQTHTNAQIAINRYWQTAGYKLFDNSGNAVMIQREDVCNIIDQNVPKYWAFFRDIIKAFLP